MKKSLLFLAAFLLLLPLPCPAETVASLAKPVVQRDSKGVVTITCATAGAHVRYDLDGSDVTKKTGPYLAPIELPHGGTVKARAFSEDRQQQSDLAETTFESLQPGPRPPSSLLAVTQDRDWPGYDWAKRHAEVCAIVRERKPRIIFIGDSITHMFGGEPHDRRQAGSSVWNKFYGQRNPANLGFGWDRTENTLWRLRHGELDGASPAVAVIHIGTNNLGTNKPDEIAAGIRAMCGEIHARSPQTKILLLAIFPRGAKPDANRTKLGEVNKLIAPLDGHHGVTFLDLSAKFLEPDGAISRDVMNDYLHPTEKGYTIWAEVMEPTLKKLLGESR